MKGPDGLKAGDLIHLVPGVDSPEDDPAGYDTRAVVVSIPDGDSERLACVEVRPHPWHGKEYRAANAIAVPAHFFDADTEWYRSQAEANEAAAASEEEYGRRCLEFARRAREGAAAPATAAVIHKAEESFGLATLCGAADHDRNLRATAIARHVTCPRCLERLAGR